MAQRINLLSDAGLLGYLPVALPRVLKPLQIMVLNEGNLQPLSSDDTLKKLFEQGDEAFYPPITKDKPLPKKLSSVSHLSTAFKANLSLLEKIKGGLGMAIDASTDDYLVFKYEEPVLQEVKSFVDMDAYLNDAKVRKGSSFAQRLYENDIYVVTSVLKAKKISYQIVNERDLKTSLDLPEIKQVVEGSFDFDSNRFVQSEISNNGDIPLTFALQAVKVKYDRSLLEKLLGGKGVFKTVFQNGMIVRGDDYQPEEKLKMEILTLSETDILL